MRLRWIAAAVALVVLDVYLLACHWGMVGGNVLAEPIILAPAFIAQHLAWRRHHDRSTAELHARLDAQDQALNIGDDHAA